LSYTANVPAVIRIIVSTEKAPKHNFRHFQLSEQQGNGIQLTHCSIATLGLGEALSSYKMSQLTHQHLITQFCTSRMLFLMPSQEKNNINNTATNDSLHDFLLVLYSEVSLSSYKPSKSQTHTPI